MNVACQIGDVKFCKKMLLLQCSATTASAKPNGLDFVMFVSHIDVLNHTELCHWLSCSKNDVSHISGPPPLRAARHAHATSRGDDAVRQSAQNEKANKAEIERESRSI